MALQDGFLHKAPSFCMADTGLAPRPKRAPQRRQPICFFGLLGPISQITLGNASRFHLHREWNCTGDCRPLPAQCKKILFIKMLIRSTLFPINQIKWPQQFQPFLGNRFFFLFLPFFPHVAPVMMVFGVSPPSHKSQRGQINSSLPKRVRQGATDFINCSGANVTGHRLHTCASSTKVGTMIWGNFLIFLHGCDHLEAPSYPQKLRTVVATFQGIL